MIKKQFSDTIYSVGEDGSIFFPNGVKIVTFKQDGYKYVSLRVRGYNFHRRVDYMVADTYFPLKDEDGEVIHLDNDINNNWYTNLQWISFESDAVADALDNSCIILCIDSKTSNLINFYRGIVHASVNNKLNKDILEAHLMSDRLFPYHYMKFYYLNELDIIDTNTAYTIFEYKGRISILRYDQSMMYRLIKFLKDV